MSTSLLVQTVIARYHTSIQAEMSTRDAKIISRRMSSIRLFHDNVSVGVINVQPMLQDVLKGLEEYYFIKRELITWDAEGEELEEGDEYYIYLFTPR